MTLKKNKILSVSFLKNNLKLLPKDGCLKKCQSQKHRLRKFSIILSKNCPKCQNNTRKSSKTAIKKDHQKISPRSPSSPRKYFKMMVEMTKISQKCDECWLEVLQDFFFFFEFGAKKKFNLERISARGKVKGKIQMKICSCLVISFSSLLLTVKNIQLKKKKKMYVSIYSFSYLSYKVLTNYNFPSK